jgi:hypothetical protein
MQEDDGLTNTVRLVEYVSTVVVEYTAYFHTSVLYEVENST